MMKIIFDLDGTLFEAGEIVISATKKFLNSLGMKFPENFDPRINIGETLEVFMESILPKELINDETKKRYIDYERAEVKKHHKLFLGVLDVLEYLKKQNYDLYICSNGSFDYINNVVNKADIKKYFPEDKIISARFSTKTKMVSEIIKDDKHAVMIGDTFKDIKAGLDNLIPTIGCTYGYGFDGELEKAHFLASKPIDIISFIEKIRLLK